MGVARRTAIDTISRIDIRDQAQKARRPDPSTIRPLAEPDLANHIRSDEMDISLRRRLIARRPPKWRRRLRPLLEHRMDLAQRIAIEAGADFVRITKRAFGFILAEQQRAEIGSL